MKKLYEGFCKVEEFICGTVFFSIVVLTLAAAVARNLHNPIVWADDMAKLLFAWAAFLGADVAFRHSRLVGVDILTNKMPPKVEKCLILFTHTLMIFILAVFVKYSFQLGIANYKRFFQTLQSVSYSWVTFSLGVGSIFMILTASIRIVKVIMHFNDDSYKVQKDTPDKRETTEELTDSEITAMQNSMLNATQKKGE